MAYTVSYAFILISVITTLALSDAIIIYKLFYNVNMPEWTKITKLGFYFMPSFHFTKVYGDVARITCKHVLTDNLIWVSGREFRYEDLFDEFQGKFATKDRYHAPSIMQTLYQLYALTAMYMTIAWYFDNVLSANRGHA